MVALSIHKTNSTPRLNGLAQLVQPGKRPFAELEAELDGGAGLLAADATDPELSVCMAPPEVSTDVAALAASELDAPPTPPRHPEGTPKQEYIAVPQNWPNLQDQVSPL